MPKYRRKPEIVEARKLKGVMDRGYWHVQYSDGSSKYLSDQEFHQTYEKLEE